MKSVGDAGWFVRPQPEDQAEESARPQQDQHAQIAQRNAGQGPPGRPLPQEFGQASKASAIAQV